MRKSQMTCIVGLVDTPSGVVYMGGDSAATGGWDLTVRRSPKVFRNGPMLMGVTGYARMAQILQYAFTPPAMPDGQSVDAYMAKTFIDALREAFKTNGYAKKESEQERTDSVLIVGFRQRLFAVSSNYQVEDSIHNYLAVGSADAIAHGVMYATDPESTKIQTRMRPDERIFLALRASEAFNVTVRAPFTLCVLEPEPEPVAALIMPSEGESVA